MTSNQTPITEEEFFTNVIAPGHNIPLPATPQEAALENPTYKGSCHCGFITYTVKLDLENPHPYIGAIVTRCNCTMCVKAGLVSIAPSPVSSFILTTPGSRGELKDYQYPNQNIHRWLCPECGIQVFCEGEYVYMDHLVSYMRINAVTVDGRVDGEKMRELKDIKPRYYGGRERETLVLGLKDEPWEHGIW